MRFTQYYRQYCTMSYLPLVHHVLGVLLGGAAHHVPDLHPAAVARAPLVRLDLTALLYEPCLSVSIP